MSMEVKCDSCRKDFEIVLTKEKRNEIEKILFICPHCNKKYITHYEDQKIKALREKIKELKSLQEKNRGKDFNIALDCFNEQQRIKREIKERMEHLQEIY